MTDMELLRWQGGSRRCCGTHPLDVPHRCECGCHLRPVLDRVAIWDSINEYASACGGDTSSATISNRRMGAVARVESLLYKAYQLKGDQ